MGTSLAAVVLFLVGTGRWGSYLGPLPGNPPYITDICVIGAVLLRLFSGKRQSVPRNPLLGAIASCILILALGHFVFDELLVADSVRDGYPYLMVALVLLAPRLPAGRVAELSWLYRVLNFHLIWVGLALIAPSIPTRLPQLQPGLGILTPRGDFDSAVCGIAAAIYLSAFLRGRKALYLAVVALNLTAAALLLSRAGFVAAVVVVFAVLLSRAGASAHHGRRVVVFTLFAASAVTLILASPSIPILQRFAGSLGLPASNSISLQAAGTENARIVAWPTLYEYVALENAEVLGLGFGRNIMEESGASVALNVQDDVRSPHNWWLDVYARLGIAGLLLITFLSAIGFVRGWRLLHGELDTGRGGSGTDCLAHRGVARGHLRKPLRRRPLLLLPGRITLVVR